MGMQRLLNAMRFQAEMAIGGVAQARFAHVTSYDKDNYCAKVKLQPEDVETGWLPIPSLAAGPQWGLFIPPPVGAQVLIVFPEGDPDNGVIVCSFWHDEARPMPVPEGEAWLVHKSGSSAKFTNDGNITFEAPLTTIKGELKVTGDITDHSDDQDVTVKQLRDDYNAHKHPGVQTGSGSTGTTDHPAT